MLFVYLWCYLNKCGHKMCSRAFIYLRSWLFNRLVYASNYPAWCRSNFKWPWHYIVPGLLNSYGRVGQFLHSAPMTARDNDWHWPPYINGVGHFGGVTQGVVSAVGAARIKVKVRNPQTHNVFVSKFIIPSCYFPCIIELALRLPYNRH